MYVNYQRTSEKEVQESRKSGGEWLRDLRQKSGLSQRQLAQKVSVDYYTFISQLENGRGRIPPDRYQDWAEALGVPVSPWIAASVCLTLYSSAYLAEIWRGCVDAVPKGQWEAAKSLGLSFVQQLRLIVLPQAAKIAIAPTVGFMVQVIKGTALASIIGFVEITKTGGMIANATFEPFLIYSFVALFYFALCFPLSWWSKRLELRLAVAGRQSP